MFEINSLGSLLLALVVAFVTVLFGTYLGVLGALQTFFGESSWQDVSPGEEE
jgi:ABC-type spermidine/putrescine transport system permease subunit II